ncbi:MAG: class A beta-lactamase-related serine hydrolase [Actinomycetota bacterium]|nr:class A beta-lactamase-related serine hydrolase [Actinomycetota bacterium]
MKWPLAAVAVLVIGSVALVSAPTATADELPTRVAAVDAYLATRPGSLGYVLTDRATGATYRNAHAGDLVWTASTIKLAMVVDLLTRARAGTISLTDGDRRQMSAMMHSSDDDAADALWSRFGGPDHLAYNADFPRYGMTDLQPQRGFSSIYPYWGFQKSTANDLDRLMTYVLTRLEPAQTAAIVYELQNVATNQQWGVWGAGPAASPGNKDGWSLEQGGWVTNSVGFAGPNQRYTLAMMNALGDAGGYDDGVATTTRVAQILLAGLSA